MCVYTLVLEYRWRWDDGFTRQRHEVVARAACMSEWRRSYGGEHHVATTTASQQPHWWHTRGCHRGDRVLGKVGSWEKCWISHQWRYVNIQVINSRLQRQHYLSHITLHHTHHNAPIIPAITIIQGGPQKLYILKTHHLFEIAQEKMKRISAKCTQSFWEQRLSCSFYATVQYSLQISSVLLYRKNGNGSFNWPYFFAITLWNMGRISSFFFCYY